MDTPTCLAVDSDQPLSVQNPIHNPEKSSCSLPETKCLKLTQDDSSTTCHLTVQGFLHGLRKPMIPPCKPIEAERAINFRTLASTGHRGLPFIDLQDTFPSPGLLDPPESSPGETDGDRVPIPAPEARRLRSPHSPGADERDVTMLVPKVVRTYTKKLKHALPGRKHNHNLPLTRSLTHRGALLDGFSNDGSNIPEERLAPKEKPKIRPAKKLTRADSWKRERQILQDNEDNAGTVISEKKSRTKRQKRRAPVNELALVTKLPIHTTNFTQQKAYDSKNAIDLLNAILDGEESPTPISPSRDKRRKQTKANVGNPIKMIHQDFGTPQRDVLARQEFKVPPITPRPTKAPGWKLGSGFDGFTFGPSANRKRRNRKVGFAREPCFSGRSLPELELSTTMSPTLQPAGQRSFPKSQIHQAGLYATNKIKPVQELRIADRAVKLGLPQRPTKTSETAAFVQVASSTALRELVETEQSETASTSCHDGIFREPVQLHLKQEIYSSPSIREPSKSEHNGWLKRKTVKFVASDKDGDEHLLIHVPTTSVSASERRRSVERSPGLRF